VPSAAGQQASKNKRFGYDGIFSSDVLEKEALPGPMDKIDPIEQREPNSDDEELQREL
jgi:hypothetical protein